MTVKVEDDEIVEPMRSWLTEAIRSEASDLHLVAGYPPFMRVHGSLSQIENSRLLTDCSLDKALSSIFTVDLVSQLRSVRNIDLSLQTTLGGHRRRFRVNLFISGSCLGGCFRVIPETIPDFEWSGFPVDLARRLAHFRNGLVLVTGITGSGKTTTLAMIINLLNHEGGYRVITIEEPIEYVFSATKNSVITQREVGVDVESFAAGLRFGLRQDPDVILVGEIRDLETAQIALSAAETGHLVFATLHTRDAKGAISRFADLFPQAVQLEIRSQLASSLRAVVSQQLIPSAYQDFKRELLLEVLFNTAPIAAAIRSGKLESIENYMMTGRSDGMLTLDESLKRLLQAGRISSDTAERYANDKAFLWR